MVARILSITVYYYSLLLPRHDLSMLDGRPIIINSGFHGAQKWFYNAQLFVL
jgi:hypothetical protein